MQIILIGGLAGSVDEADEGVQRVLALRAEFASDGVGIIILGQIARDLPDPTAGTVWEIGTSTATLTSVPTTTFGGTFVVDARSDTASLQMQIDLD